MKFLFITLFPEQIEQATSHSIIKRALEAGLIQVACINPRDFTTDRHRTVDDSPFGGGAGMVLKPGPMVEAIKAAKAQLPSALVVAMSPGGRTFKQAVAQEYAQGGRDLILVCGHYEGFDARIFHWVDEKMSIGDYVLTGGELPALVIMDAVARFIPGVLGKLVSAEEDSFSTGLLEYPQYTRPVVYEGLEVPEVLRNGNHALINRWRRKEALRATKNQRPDLLGPLAPADQKLVTELEAEEAEALRDAAFLAANAEPEETDPTAAAEPEVTDLPVTSEAATICRPESGTALATEEAEAEVLEK